MSYRIWVVAIGEPLPVDADHPRLLRAGIVAQMLATAKHDVTWWTANVDHTRKRHRFAGETEHQLEPNLRLILLDGTLYTRNVSLARIQNHRDVAAGFRRRSELEPRPDVILCSFPTIELAREVVSYGRRHNIPVAIDIRDLWPDVLAEVAPRPLRWLADIFLAGMRRDARRALQGATAIIGVTDHYRDWGLALAGRSAGPFDRTFAMAYVAAAPSMEAQRVAKDFWSARGVGRDPEEFVVAFFGTLGRQFDLAPVIAAAKLMRSRQPKMRFVLCGAGDNFEHYRAMADGLDNVLFPGWVNAPQIWALMQQAKLGVAPYIDSDNFRKNVANKVIEYMSAGLPVVTPITGAVETLLKAHDAGYFYAHGSAQGLADLLASAFNDPETLARRSQNARQAFQQAFSAERVYGELCAYLEALASRREAADPAKS